MRTLCSLILLLIVHTPVLGQTSPGELFQLGVHKEEVEGQLPEAIEAYLKIVKLLPADRHTSAAACLRMAFCYEKLGDERAVSLYASILEKYPDQKEIVKIARTRLAQLGTPRTISKRTEREFVDYYIRRVYRDPLSALSPDGTKEATTDWTTGNLVVKDRVTGEITQLTDKSWKESSAFAFWKVWSSDGKKIAYAWYHDSWSADLRVISIEDRIPHVLFQHDAWSVLPCDWSSDGRFIVVKILEKQRLGRSDTSTEVASISFPAGVYRYLTAVDGNARGFRISPDCRSLAYDCLDRAAQVRRLRLLELSTLESRVLTFAGTAQNDMPLWSQDGNYLLFQTSFGAEISLMCAPIREGKSAGDAIVLDPQIGSTVLRKSSVEAEAFSSEMRRLQAAVKAHPKDIPSGFEENFDKPHLDSSWNIIEYKGRNVYGFSSFGKYSLESNPGSLRYSLDQMMVPGVRTRSSSNYSYWHYPSLELRKSFRGTHWELETGVTYVSIDGADARNLILQVQFNEEASDNCLLEIDRRWEWYNQNCFGTRLVVAGRELSYNTRLSLPEDVTEELRYSCRIRIARRDTLVTVDLSRDGIHFHRVMAETVPREHLGSIQQLVLTGGAWFTPAGSYADWDYFRLRALHSVQ